MGENKARLLRKILDEGLDKHQRMAQADLELTTDKTEIVIFNGKRKIGSLNVEVYEVKIEVKDN